VGALATARAARWAIRTVQFTVQFLEREKLPGV
jgi:hypothetical protein